MNTFILIIESAILASALSLDAFVASFAYGSDNIRIPLTSALIIDAVCGGMLGIALFVGSVIREYIPAQLTMVICFIILFLLGLVKLLDSITKSIIRKYSGINGKIHFSMFNIKFVLSLYADPEAADVDHSKSISAKEAVSLAVALSLDGIAVGFGAAIGDANAPLVLVSSLVIGALAIFLGAYTGHKLARKLTFNMSWVSGAILIGLAVLNLV